MGKYSDCVGVFKALSDATRIDILITLQRQELCACKLLEKYDITQPTLSHHMKKLTDAGLVIPTKVGKWSHYSLNKEKIQEIKEWFDLGNGLFEQLLSPLDNK